MRTYTGPHAAKIAQVSYRQCDHWARTGLVRPTAVAAHGSGSAREYTADDILRLAVVRCLLDAGLSTAGARRHLDEPTDVSAVVRITADVGRIAEGLQWT